MKNIKNIRMKGILMVIVTILVIVTGVSIYLISSTPKLELKQETFTIEYGEIISDQVRTYIKDDFKFLKDVKLNLQVENEKEKDYPSVGKYKGSITYKDTVLEFKMIVKDTTAPKFEDLGDTIKIEKNAENVDFVKYFKVSDLSDVTIDVNNTDVDLSKEGNYAIKVIATDIYKNKTEKHVKIIVINKEEAKKGEATKYADGSAAPKAKDEKSDDTKVVQNNSSGSSSSSNSNQSDRNTSGENSEGSSGIIITFPEGHNLSEAMIVYNTINQLRRKEGLGDLPYDYSLQALADKRAKEISTIFSHDAFPGGPGLTEVIAEMGSCEGSAAYAWRNSPGHWYALSEPNRTGIAIGCYQKNGLYYYSGVITYTPYSD